MPKRDFIVIGGSSGSLEALKILASGLAPDLPAAVMVVQHILPDARPFLPEILNRFCPLMVKLAEDGERIESGKIYVAAPDHHLIVVDGGLRLTRTARENRARPAVDALFRTAAATHGSRVIGVILTGNLDDGAAGLKAVQDCGGLAIVQDPEDADYPGMPEAALRYVEPDHLLPITRIAGLLNRVAGEEVEKSAPIDRSLEIENLME